MARDILSEYGPESPQHQAARATNGGKMPVRDVHNYSPPKGPLSIHDHGPGLHENNYGNCGTQGRHSEAVGTTGHPGIDHDNHGNKGSQR